MNSLLAQISGNASQAANAAANGAEQSAQSELVQTLLNSVSIFTNLVIGIVIIVLFYIFGKLLARRIVKGLREAKGESLYPDMVILINRFLVYGSLFVGFAVVIQFVFNMDFIQVLGFFGLGISFAFKDILSNLIAGAVIIIQNRFRIGDFIEVGQNGMKGKIMEIQTRATILKSIHGTEIVIPNAQLLVKPVTSYTAHHRRRISFKVGISFDSDINLAKKLATDVMKNHEFVLKKPSPYVLVSGIEESAVTLDMRFYIDPQDKSYSWIQTKSELITKVKQTFDENGIEIPFPIRTIKGDVSGRISKSKNNTSGHSTNVRPQKADPEELD